MGDAPVTIDDLIERERACGVQYGPFWQHKYLERAPEVVRRQVELARRFPGIVAMRNTMVTERHPGLSTDPLSVSGSPEFGSFPPTSFTPVTAGTSTPIFNQNYTRLNTGAQGGGSALGTDLCAGNVYRFCWGGIYSNRTTSSPASTWDPMLGSSVSLGASAAVYSGAALTNAPMYGEFTLGIRFAADAAGGGAANGNGFIFRGTGAGGAGTVRQTIGGTVETTFDLLTDGNNYFMVNHTWSATNASNTLTVQWIYMETLN